jgi:F-type H+-transporting ATPase subunit a
VTGPKKRGCLGCSFPVLIIIAVIVIAIIILGLMSGAIGQSLLGKISWLSWMSVPKPEPHLPAPVLFHILGWPITNGVLAGWITVVFLVVISWVVSRRMQIVPRRLQTAFEFILGWIYDLCNSIAGEVNGRKFFPVVCTIFLFVLFNAWLSLIPGYGSIELIKHEPIPENAQIVPSEEDPEHLVALVDDKEYEIATVDGQETIVVEEELIRGANTDVNTPLALALVSFVFVAYFGLKSLGMGWLKQYFNFGPLFHSFGRIFKGKLSIMDIFSGVIDAFVGGLELLSRFITIISFTFRLFGNMTAGEILLLIAAFLVPWVLAIPFYGLELLIGVVQALIFSLLTLVFVTMAVTSTHGSESAEHE